MLLVDHSHSDAQKHASFTILVPAHDSLPEDCVLSATASSRVERPPRDAKAPVWGSTPVRSSELHAVQFDSGGVPPWTTMQNSCVVLHVHGSGRGARLLRIALWTLAKPSTAHRAVVDAAHCCSRPKIAPPPSPVTQACGLRSTCSSTTGRTRLTTR
jgi:hypothetical protein